FVTDDGSSAKIGFTLEPNAQGRGIATAAVREAIHILFAATKVQHVFGITDTRNGASIRLLERTGFRLQATQETIFRGEPCSEKIYVIARNEAGKTGGCGCS
ncbi:MAG TPA: GNAT family protein, partial [Candidatus Polarisedimenticolia bacterium]|nr:GNAT family protein [Candidatus Polarisedimenticolia bacterium]